MFTLPACRVPYEQPLVPQAEYIFDPGGSRLLVGPRGDDLTRVRAVIAERHTIDWKRWLAERFSCAEEWEQRMWQFDPKGPLTPDLGLCFSGFLFRSERGILHYKAQRSRFIDGYNHYLSWRSTDGKNRWRRRVPFIEVPVYPFVVGDWVMYITGRHGAHLLLVISLRSGKILLKYDVTEPGCYFSQLEMPMHGYYSNGFIVVQPAVDFVGKGQSSKLKWGNIRVLKLPE